MDNTPTKSRDIGALIDAIYDILLKRGLSHTSMDLLASQLQISKRTLYEIFGSKDDMIRRIFEAKHRASRVHMEKIFRESDNAMVAMLRIVSYHQSVFGSANVAFFRDMEQRAKHLRPDYDHKSHDFEATFGKVYELGISQGVFRKTNDYALQMRLLSVQMESLKRMEEFFPPDITFAEACRVIIQSLLRSLATPKGLEILDTEAN